MALDDPLTIAIIAITVVTAIVVCIVVILGMRHKYEKKTPKLDKVQEPSYSYNSPVISSVTSPFRVSKSVQANDAVRAKDELRILDLEREILGDAIRHLYEAHAAGKITEAEREKLASNYKTRMMTIKEAMAKDETIVALHELESMQEDLMKLFNERFGELTGKVDELRGRIDVKPVKEIRIQPIKPQRPVAPDQIEEDEEADIKDKNTKNEDIDKPKKARKAPAEKQKTEAEQRIDAIRNQIDEVMNKLGQIEIES
ncbi:MAG: hypothetical protein GX638_02985 [Crenarchaeota archaeon]|nr:hypothetical protein [Thermoproteota archaeon]